MKLEIINHSQEEEINLVNAKMDSFISSHKLFKLFTNLEKVEKEESYPKPIEFKIDDDFANNKNYLFLIHRNKEAIDFSNCIKKEIKGDSFSMDNLYPGTTYFCKVKDIDSNLESNVVSFKTKQGIRTIRIDGVLNVRDLGEYKEKKNRIKFGMVYRGANLDNISEQGKKDIASLNIKTIIDLREKNYRKQTLNNVNYIDLPEKGGPYYANGNASIFNEEYRKALLIEIKTFANKENYPIYFHCQIGRDRTGTLSFILKGLLGINYKDLVKDYELSFFSIYGTNDYRKTLGSDLKKAVKILHDFFIKKAKENKEKRPTLSKGIESFLLEIGINKEEIKNIKKIMLGSK